MRPLKEKEMHKMSIFKRNKKSDDSSITKIEENKDLENIEVFKSVEINEGETSDKPTELEDINKSNDDFESIDFVIDNLLDTKEKIKEEDTKPEKKKEKKQPKSKKKSLIKKDMKGKSVFLEDTGEEIGTVFDMIYDGEKNLIAYKIKDNKSETTLSFPVDQFNEDKNGLIFVPSWYTQGVKTIEELEFKDRITPELTWLLADNTISEEELYNIFVKHDDKIASYMEKATTLKGLINNRLKILERERVRLKEDLMDLTEKRLIKDIDRRRFSEVVMEHRRKANVLDVNIKKCKELTERLEHTSFGALSNNMILNIENERHFQERLENFSEKDIVSRDNKIEDTYKDKYYDLKERYEELQETHNELKAAVEKLLNKSEI